MKVYLYLLLLSYLLIQSRAIHAQEGSLYITNYSESSLRNAEVIAIEHDRIGNMLFASQYGLISFNGHAWNINKMPCIITALKRYSNTDTIFAGGLNNFGYIIKQSNGSYDFTELKSDLLNEVIDIQIIDEYIYFFSKDEINIYNIKNSTLKKESNLKAVFLSGFRFEDKLVLVTTNGLQMLDNESMYELNINNEPSNIIYGTALSPKRFVVTTDENEFYLFENGKFKLLSLNENQYIPENIFLSSYRISENELLAITLLGGAVIININTGEILHKINYQSGLPDDEIIAYKLDESDGLWFSHKLGISRIDLSLPVYSYSYEGLNGIPLDVCSYKDTLYVATSEGLFYLHEQSVFTDKHVYTPKTITKLVTINENDTKKRSKRRRLQNITETKEITKTIKIRETVKELNKKKFSYTPVNDLHDKCKQLTITSNGLFAAGNNGVYEIFGNTFKTILTDKYIHSINYFDEDSLIIIAHESGIFTYNIFSKQSKNLKLLEPIYNIAKTPDKKLIASSENRLFTINYKTFQYRDIPIKDRYISKITPLSVDTNTFVFANGDIFSFNTQTETLTPAELFNDSLYDKMITYNKGIALFKNNQWYFPVEHSKANLLLNLFPDITGIYQSKIDIWFIDNAKDIFRIPVNASYFKKFNLYLNSIYSNDSLIVKKDNISLSHEHNTLRFNVIAPYFIEEEGVTYIYEIEGFDKEWIQKSKLPELHLNFIPPGNYILHITAENKIGLQTNTLSISFSVSKPFTQTIYFYLIIIVSAIIILLVIIKIRLHKLEKDKRVLEQKVKARTKTIEEQKEEIESQRDKLLEINEELYQQKEEIATQRDEIESQRDHIMEQTSEIVQSIEYAQKIQNAVMPKETSLEQYLSDYFILFKPRDIVSGDFYWSANRDNKLIIAAADCTGHGVPGAFMSMLGITLLNEIVLKTKVVESDKILDHLRINIINTLSETAANEENSKDGMDIALCAYDPQTQKLEFSGAYNSALYIRNKQLFELPADKMPIGRHDRSNTPFTKHIIDVQKDDVFYIFSDGFQDQFGGPQGKKFKKKQLKDILLTIHTKPLPEQEQILFKTLEDWKGNEDQVDDVLVIGFKI